MPSFISAGAGAVGVLAFVLGGAPEARAQDGPDGQSLFGKRTASVTYGPYVRLEFGLAQPSLDSALWQPPGPADPSIFFDADGQDGSFGGVALGFDWQNGIRADMSVFGTETGNVSATCASTSDGSPCSAHVQDISASVTTKGLMANGYYAPLEARGSNSTFQPFLVAGVGLARNEVGQWTRTNPAAGQPTRSFEGDTSTDLAWSVGVGASFQVTRAGARPIIIEAMVRHFDFGTASGGTTPLPGNGTSTPIKPFTFDRSDQVVTLGVRIPLQRY